MPTCRRVGGSASTKPSVALKRGSQTLTKNRKSARWASSGALMRTPLFDQMLRDLMLALEQDKGQRLGGKSAEAARFILRAIDRELANA